MLVHVDIIASYNLSPCHCILGAFFGALGSLKHLDITWDVTDAYDGNEMLVGLLH